MEKIILLGAPGSGKGTQATKICERFGIPHISTGDIFRDNIRNHTEIGRIAKTFIELGQLVPDDITLTIVRNRLNEKDCDNGYLMDGFPRTINQADAMISMLSEVGSYFTKVICIDVPYEVLFARMTGRRVCDSCGISVNTQLGKPKVENKCDRCGGNLIIRDDDKPETVAARLQVYTNQTEPLKAFYEKQGLLAYINGEQAVDDVFTDILKALEK